MKRLLLAALATASLAAMPALARAADTTIQVVAVGHGSVQVKPAPKAAVNPDGGDCLDPSLGVVGNRTDIRASSCALTYDAGTVVTLTANGGPQTSDPDPQPGPATTFAGWSDDGCPSPPANSCSFALDGGDRSIAALFSPQRVSWWVVGGGSVSGPPSRFPTVDCSNGSGNPCVGRDYDLGADVSLAAAGPSPVAWVDKPNPQNDLTMCDEVVGTTCHLTAIRPRWAGVTFAGAPFEENVPPEVSVVFRIRKAGSGSGTVRSGSLDCGTTCAVDRTFGATETLQAVPDRGSRFARWQAACGTALTCRLAVGPVTAVTAVFESGPPSPSPTPSPGPSGGARARPLAARLQRLNVRGHGRGRKLLIRVHLTTAATVRARLVRGRRQVATGRWQVSAGSHLLRMRVPARARPGVYRLFLTVSGAGQAKEIARRVRLRR
jgi:hypothetical protein